MLSRLEVVNRVPGLKECRAVAFEHDFIQQALVEMEGGGAILQIDNSELSVLAWSPSTNLSGFVEL
jgi:hypothetical protein